MTRTNDATTTWAFDSPETAIAAMCEHLTATEVETVDLSEATGRVHGESVRSDRPSPACDVSAMDGYAVRLADLTPGETLPIHGEVFIGHAPPAMPSGAALRIFTGGAVPDGCNAVIPREQVEERGDAIRLPNDLAVKPGQHIRRGGENAPAAELVLQPGIAITPAVLGTLATFGRIHVKVHQSVRLAAIVTGNELHDPAADVQPWQLRDSNGPVLHAMFSGRPWIDWRGADRVGDDRRALRAHIERALADCDALILTGGVSMGDYDFVPAVLRDLGCAVVFHKLPIRPGKPVLGAIGPDGHAVLGLPGNPVSVMATARRIGAATLRHCAGFAEPDPPLGSVTLTNPDDKPLHLHWSRPVRLTEPGEAALIPTRGSGDPVSAARSDGFITIPPNATGPGPWPFYPWSIT